MKPGDVYVKRTSSGNDIFRRIIAIHQGVVAYSRGSDTNGLCTIESFSKWASDKRVERVEPDLLSNTAR